MNQPGNDMDARISAALHAAVDGLHERDLRPALPPHGVPARHRTIRWAAPLLAAAAVVAVVVTSLAVSSGPQAAKHGVPPAGSSVPKPTPSIVKSPVPSAPGSQAASEASSRAAVKSQLASSLANQPSLGGFEPLWPFATITEAGAWEAANRRGGHSSWHLDAGQTALSFVRTYLKFSDITDVTSTSVTAKDAHIGVGYPSPSGQPHTAAVLHLLRFATDGTDPGAPWEVVGATSTDFSITDPGPLPDALVEPVIIRGRITGTDENVTVAVRKQDGSFVQSAPTAAGGDNAPWSVGVDLNLSGVLTVVASTGGHVTAHERFVVVGVTRS